MAPDTPKPLIDLRSFFKDPLRQKVFSVVGGAVEKVLAIDAINQIYYEAAGCTDDRHFLDKVLDVMNIELAVREQDLARIPRDGRLVVETVVAVSFCVFFCYQFFPRQITALFGTGSDLYFEFAAKFFRIFLMLICVNGLQSSVGGFFSAQGKPAGNRQQVPIQGEGPNRNLRQSGATGHPFGKRHRFGLWKCLTESS